MSGDFNKPITTENYANVLQDVRDMFADLGRGLDPAYVSTANLPVNAFRWNNAQAKFQSYNGSTWLDAAATYNVNAQTASKWATARTLTLSGGDVTGAASIDGSANIALTANLSSAGLRSIAGLTTAADKMIYTTGLNAYAVTSLTANARGLLDDSDYATMRSTLGLVIGANVAGLATENQTLTGGVVVTSKNLGNITTGTLTPEPGSRPLQYYTNGGNHTLAPSANDGSLLLDVVNSNSAGSVSTSGFNFVAGDGFTQTTGDKFRCHLSKINGFSMLQVQALQ